ncbi:hypothetical protein [Marichromatium gracile]|uniref:hypothetical protein n=1 Tax=Marichromatium gracile TaxID=1048 RepID=UPI0014048529|nr:hypothetical protein [Marichromatium gracile]
MRDRAPTPAIDIDPIRSCPPSPRLIGTLRLAKPIRLAAGDWWLEAGDWKLATGSWWLEAGGWKLVAEGRRLPPGGDQPSIC